MAHWHIGNVHDTKLCLYLLFQKCSIWNNNCIIFLVGMWKRNFLAFLSSDQRKSRIWLHFLLCFVSNLTHVLVSTISLACHQLLMVLPCFDIFFALQFLVAVKCSRILQIHFICVFVFICNASPAAATPHSSQSAIASSMGKHNCEGMQA